MTTMMVMIISSSSSGSCGTCGGGSSSSSSDAAHIQEHTLVHFEVQLYLAQKHFAWKCVCELRIRKCTVSRTQFFAPQTRAPWLPSGCYVNDFYVLSVASMAGSMNSDRTARVRLTRSICHPSSPPFGLAPVKTYQHHHHHHYSTPLLINEGNKKPMNIFVRKYRSGLVSTKNRKLKSCGQHLLR